MRRLILTGIIAALALGGLWGCSIQKTPSQPAGPGTGQVYVTAQDPYGHQVVGASIYLDGTLQSEVTPDTLTTTPGAHTILIERSLFLTDTNAVTVTAGELTSLICVLDLIDPNVGSIAVSATEQGSSAPLSGQVFLDQASAGLYTPDTLEYVPVGPHQVGVGLLGYDYAEVQVNVTTGQTASVAMQLAAAAWNGIQVVSDQDPAQVSVDEKLTGGQTPWVVTGILDGSHSFSCYREGYATLMDSLCPALQMANLFCYGQQQLSFKLQPWSAGVGHNVGQLALGFSLQSDFLDTISLGAYRGRVVLLTFWFRNCVPCMQEMPEIEDVYEQLSPQGFRVLGINYMSPDTPQTLAEVREDLGITFQFLMDYGYVVTMAYGATQFPTNVLIDQRGVVTWYTGSLTAQSLTDHVLALLNP